MTDPDRGYIDWCPNRRTAPRLEAVLQALADYHDHLPVTVRQLFYILVARMVIEKTKLEYRNLAYLLRKARRARVIPFEDIHDQGSVLPYSLDGNGSAYDLELQLRSVVRRFDLDPQQGQATRLVTWCEALGMRPQLERVADPYGVKVISGGGFDSLSDKEGFARLVDALSDEEAAIDVLHIGDLDKHGPLIFTALAEDVQAFAGNGRISFTRLAITPEQVAFHDLPTDPDQPGVVQAEALPPDVLATILDTAIRDRLDPVMLDLVRQRSAVIREEFAAKLRSVGLWDE